MVLFVQILRFYMETNIVISLGLSEKTEFHSLQIKYF